MPRPAQRFAVALLFCFASFAHAQSAGKPARIPATQQEQRAIRAFDAAKKNPLELTAFLVNMPKGGDLHMHLSGAVYAESFIRQASTDTLCYSPATRSLFTPSATTRSTPPQPVCGEGNRRAEDAFKDQKLYDTLVDDFSMRSFVPSAGVSGHDQFFATFSRFSSVKRTHVDEWLDEVATRAAAQNEQYLEIMQTPDFSAAAKLGYSIPWPIDPRRPPAMNRTGDATGTTTRRSLSQSFAIQTPGQWPPRHRHRKSHGTLRRSRWSQQARELRNTRCHSRLLCQNSIPLSDSPRLPTSAGLRANSPRLRSHPGRSVDSGQPPASLASTSSMPEDGYLSMLGIPPPDAHARLPAQHLPPKSTSPSMLASSPPASSRSTVSASTSAKPSTSDTPNASVARHRHHVRERAASSPLKRWPCVTS